MGYLYGGPVSPLSSKALFGITTNFLSFAKLFLTNLLICYATTLEI